MSVCTAQENLTPTFHKLSSLIRTTDSHYLADVSGIMAVMTDKELVEMIVSNSRPAFNALLRGNYENAYHTLSKGFSVINVFERVTQRDNSVVELKVLESAKTTYIDCLIAIEQLDYQCAYHALNSVLDDLYAILSGKVDADADADTVEDINA